VAIERIVGLAPAAVSVVFELCDRQGARLRSGEPGRGAGIDAVAIGVAGGVAGSGSSSPPGNPVLLLERELTDTDLLADLLAPLWSAGREPASGSRGETGRPPYVVFDDAHRALTVLAELDLAAPARFGCATVAATLLAEGADRRRDHRPLERSVREQLGHELPENLLGGASGRARLAAEADALLALLQAATPTLRERRLARVYSFECELLPAVVAMERAGIGVDPAAFERVASSWVRERRELEAEAEAELEPETAPEPSPRTERLARLDKLISTYRWWARDFVGPDHRIRPHLHPLATDTGRFTCTEPNLQQVPAEHTAPGLRACFVPAPGCKLILADYAQIELRVAAHLAPCEALRAVFRAGRDPHRATAARLAGKPESAIDEHERKLAKAINFGFLFGMGARRFRSYAAASYGLELDERAAEHARAAFFATFPGIAAWHRRIAALGRRAANEPITVTTALGRRRTFPPGQFSFNSALNIPVQGTAAEGFKLAILRLQAPLAAIGGRGVMVVHDEYIAEVPAAQAEQGRRIVEAQMVAAMAEIVDTVPIVVEAEIADRWK
jgi:DNA polymerase I-like protein with 3'-5' exonuclease and polymerase domains